MKENDNKSNELRTNETEKISIDAMLADADWLNVVTHNDVNKALMMAGMNFQTRSLFKSILLNLINTKKGDE